MLQGRAQLKQSLKGSGERAPHDQAQGAPQNRWGFHPQASERAGQSPAVWEPRARLLGARDPCWAQPAVQPVTSWEISRWEQLGPKRACGVDFPAGSPVSSGWEAPSPSIGYTDLL